MPVFTTMTLDLTASSRIRYAKITVCLTWLVTLLISWKLWLTDRNYPFAPVFDFIPAFPFPLDYIALALMVILLICIIIKPYPRYFILALFGLFWIEAAADQNRLQPYFYQFVFMLLCIGIVKKEDGEKEHVALNALRIIMIGVYLWSGIQKMNPYFITRFYQFFTFNYPVVPGFEPHDTLRKYSILALPAVEILIPIGLMFKNTRRTAVTLAIMMHIFIATYLSPLGFGWNLVVIPWNIGLIFMNIFLFWKSDFSLSELWHPKRSLVKAVVIVLFCIMPAFNLVGLWDHYLSASLYSCKIQYGAIFIDDGLKKDLPPYIKRYVKEGPEGEYIETTYWILGELNVTPYPEERVYEKVRDYVCTFSDDTCHANLILYR